MERWQFKSSSSPFQAVQTTESSPFSVENSLPATNQSDQNMRRKRPDERRKQFKSERHLNKKIEFAEVTL